MENTNRNCWLHIRLTENEKAKIKRNFAATTQIKLSDYARKILLGKPMIVSYRNQTMEELMAVLVQLKKELNFIGHNYNQAVKKLHTLDQIKQYQL